MFAEAENNPLEQNRPLRPPLPRWLEDYRFLDDQDKRTDAFDSVRYRRLGEDAWLQLGGEARYSGYAVKNPFYGKTSVADDTYMQQRLQVHGDLHLFDDLLRVFGQLENTRSWGQDIQSPRDEGRNDIHQLFIESNSKLGSGTLGARLGRQEMAYGAPTLVSYAESPNIRQAFDGLRVSFNQPGSYRIDGFYTRLIRYDGDNFDDSSDNKRKLYGLYGTMQLSALTGLDLYAMALEQKDRKLLGTVGDDDRYTLGARAFGASNGFDWSWDLIHQQGQFGRQDIEAWGVLGETGYTFANPWKLRVALHMDATSGDKDSRDGTAGTFDPMFPRNGIYGEANLTTPANLIAVGPIVSFVPHPRLRIEPGIFRLWRESTEDAVYTPGMQPVQGTANASGKEIGTAYRFNVRWIPTANLTLDLDYEFLDAGQVIREVDGKDSSFVSLRTSFRF
ncbi:alginate export family protein [Pseudomonas schmalbachii]|uniref:Alginate export family protein n=1 Tax=Pseudomonas schmalbachii TaxID=2816993 RepID=A0ABS3TT79_9PSED|nr:alginate export family protein [Pseudomonas schmalbachii]MBO3276879.1 alginate export family protein [Pseudomonas schmalbachii]